MKNALKYLGVAFGAIVVFCIVSYIVSSQVTLGDQILTGTVTNSSTNASTTSVSALISANPGRNYLYMCNDGSNTTYLHLTSTTTNVAAAKGIRLASAGCFTFDNTNLYLGAIYGVTASGTSTLSYIEK